jgi:DNA repair exonuclease SbcCD nuclease subunit
VGPADYTFRYGPDVVRGRDIPGGFAAVLAGHVHRSQLLTHDLRPMPLASPVIYPGSVERTSFAERDEEKHYGLLSVDPDGSSGGRLADLSFVRLPARPMVDLVVELDGLTGESLTQQLLARFASLDPEAVVRVRVQGSISADLRAALSAPSLRAIAPPTMNVSLASDTWRSHQSLRADGRRTSARMTSVSE